VGRFVARPPPNQPTQGMSLWRFPSTAASTTRRMESISNTTTAQGGARAMKTAFATPIRRARAIEAILVLAAATNAREELPAPVLAARRATRAIHRAIVRARTATSEPCVKMNALAALPPHATAKGGVSRRESASAIRGGWALTARGREPVKAKNVSAQEAIGDRTARTSVLEAIS